MTSYPKWLYHATEAPVLVETLEAHRARGAAWAESPAEVVRPATLVDEFGDTGIVQPPAPKRRRRPVAA